MRERKPCTHLLLGGAMLVLLVGWAGLRAGTGGHAGDFPLYEQYARRCLDGEVPYRDFGVEYPPASLLVMVLPALLPGPYEAWFALEMGTFALGTLALTLSVADLVGADRQRTAVAFMVGVLALSVLPPRYFDLAPTCLVVGALFLLLRRRPALAAGATLALGVLTKVFPVVLVPVGAVWLVAAGDRRALRRAALGFGLVLLSGIALAVAVSPRGAAEMVRYHVDRPAQVHSTPAVLLRLGEVVGLGAPRAKSGFGSDNVVGPGGGTLIAFAIASTTVMLVALLARLGRTLRRRTASAETARWRLVAAGFSAIVAFVVFGKVLSPQYLIWLIPVLALLAGRGAWRMVAILLAAMLLTSVDTGATYFRLVKGDPLAVCLVAVRNLLLVGLLGALWREVNEPPSGLTSRLSRI
jgi:4-amino-4-deoxy-L-arabinose transferase-like glycosyltransferase